MQCTRRAQCSHFIIAESRQRAVHVVEMEPVVLKPRHVICACRRNQHDTRAPFCHVCRCENPRRNKPERDRKRDRSNSIKALKKAQRKANAAKKRAQG